MRKIVYILFLTGCLVACGSETNYAPVTDISTIEHIPKNGMYRVTSGETLYSIAWRYGLDYRYLANLNHIAPPYHVVAGQRIYLNQKLVRVGRNNQSKNMAPVSPEYHDVPVVRYVEQSASRPVSGWRWPTRGSIIDSYSSLNKGVNIGGHIGQPIYATASGQVVYNGNGLRGYGNLIIIKHNNAYLSAYAHNSVSLVREGQRVRAGQEIAEMGNTGARQTMLHFEIRHNGRPVNPLNYLVSH